MKEIRKTSIKHIKEQSALDTIIDLRNDEYSLLDTLGLHDMKSEMRDVGKTCQKVLNLAEKLARPIVGDYKQSLRTAMGKILKWQAPYEVKGSFPHPKDGLVFGFNHPTLGEIFRLIAVCVTEYSNRRYLFPVNIVWYEELAPLAYRMEKFGLYITPTITPATRDKLAERLSEKRLAIVDNLAAEFNKIYLNACAEFISGGDIVMIAPSATRQKTVFKNREQLYGYERIEPQTMTLLAIELDRRIKLKCYFMPLAIIPPSEGNNGLNMKKTYILAPSEWISPDGIRRLYKSKDTRTGERRLERFFLNKISDELGELGRDDLIVP